MRTIIVRDIDTTVAEIRQRPKPTKKQKKIVSDILVDVQKNPEDSTLIKYEKKDGKLKVNLKSIRVSNFEIKNAYSRVTKDQINAIKLAKKRLERTELTLKNKLEKITIQADGIKITKRFVPIESVGCYIPGGEARYPSTVVMSVVPAKVAGVRKIVAISPPDKNGDIDPLTLVAADICGVNEFYKAGVAGIAALAYGSKSVPKVDKIVGPGGLYVTIAKSLVSETVSIDMVAGPTELAIIADSSTDPNLVAVDLISQAEHGPASVCCLITTSTRLKNLVLDSLQKQIGKIQRQGFVKASLENNGFIAICKNESDVIEFANRFAPEHLEIITKNPQQIAQKITSAGLVLVGKDTPSSASDYLLGSNHILPTNGFARTRGSLGVLDFLKIQSQVETSRTELQKISKFMEALTNAEGLPNHYEAIRTRLK
ncbi:MAG TPA: histidinol dehydrogenase [Nitrosopumilaceae archaeon]|nr:histidinol dehydrogenase [Nitrosopumilaceae archaeon]